MNTTMSPQPKKFREYYRTGQYKNYYKLKERKSTLTGQTHVTFTNGIKEVFASGRYTEAALKEIFSQIDKLSSKKESYKYQV